MVLKFTLSGTSLISFQADVRIYPTILSFFSSSLCPSYFHVYLLDEWLLVDPQDQK